MTLNSLLEKILGGWVGATSEKFSGHQSATQIRIDLVETVKSLLGDDATGYLFKASAGAGNWASVPWMSILDPNITESTQSGVYPVYLFRADGTGVYLSLGFGTTELKEKYGSVAIQQANDLRSQIRSADKRLNKWNDDLDLKSNTTLGKSYEWGSAGAKFYSFDNIPSEEILLADLHELLKIYADVTLESELPESEAHSSHITLCKPFLLLAGISGTGKTRFVREQASVSGSLYDTYQLTAVRPDWLEPADLLGYSSRLSGKAEYVVTDVLRFISKAWIAIVDAGVEIEAFAGAPVSVKGKKSQLREVLPHWLCLDEMNLAPVEQYFADYLSILETREWQWEESRFTYLCDPLLSASTITDLATSEQDRFRSEVGLDDAAYDSLWACFCDRGIGIPVNLIVAGTVNMDETTHGFSRKVLDRALTIDFDEFFPNVLRSFFDQQKKSVTFTYPILSQASKERLPKTDAGGGKLIAFLERINSVLDGTPFKVAYRALNELLLMVICMKPETELELRAVWDDFLMLKVLPRIEGDVDKLVNHATGVTVLKGLLDLIEGEFSMFNVDATEGESERPDLFQITSTGSELTTGCRSSAKIMWMQQRLETSGFTSFWP